MNYLARHLIIVFSAIALTLLAFMLGVIWYGHWYDSYSGVGQPISYGGCNIAVIPIQGDVVAYDGDSLVPSDATVPVSTSGDWVTGYMRSAIADPSILGVMVQVDSYGGLAAPAEQMMNAFTRSPVPVVSYIREVGASAAYLAATGAETIVASPFAQIGSIGITYSYVDNTESNKQQGYTFVQLSSGPFKDTGNPNKPLSNAERALYERDITIYKDLFVSAVSKNRKLSTTTVDAIADGSTMPSQIALEKGLIDAIGDDETVREEFAKKLNMPVDSIVLCR